MASDEDLNVKTEMRDGFKRVHQLILRARIERLKAQSFADLEDATWADATLIWINVASLKLCTSDSKAQGLKWIEKIQLAREYRAEKEKAIEAAKAFEEFIEGTPANEIWTEKTIKEYREKFGENMTKADGIMRRITSILGEREAIKAMEELGKSENANGILDGMDASDVIQRLENEMGALMEAMGSLKKGGADGKSK